MISAGIFPLLHNLPLPVSTWLNRPDCIGAHLLWSCILLYVFKAGADAVLCYQWLWLGLRFWLVLRPLCLHFSVTALENVNIRLNCLASYVEAFKWSSVVFKIRLLTFRGSSTVSSRSAAFVPVIKRLFGSFNFIFTLTIFLVFRCPFTVAVFLSAIYSYSCKNELL